MRVLVTGASGQVGRDVVEVFSRDHSVGAYTRRELDVTDLEKTLSVVTAFKPDAIIHTAAYTSVDRAEIEPELAYAINVQGSRNIALAGKATNSKVCAISTDYVFDGATNSPYDENSVPNPLNMYGKTKLDGERVIQTITNKFFIVRTSWVFGLHGNNFVKAILRNGGGDKQLRIVNDQVGCPTYSRDLGRFLLELVKTDNYGLYHATNSGACTWYEFACAIFKEVNMKVSITPCTTAEFPQLASRPKYSVLRPSSTEKNNFTPLRPWCEALHDFIKEVGKNGIDQIVRGCES